jgi:predicted outer membrane protein
MRGFAGAVCVALLAAACSRGEAAKTPSFDAKAFIATTASLARSDVDLGDLAVRKGRLPQTRQLAAALAAEQRALLGALAPVAQRRGVAMPAGLEDRRVALHQNLSILSGQVFDRAWALAMVQDYDAIVRGLGDASDSGDDDLRAFAARVQPAVMARRKAANDLLAKLGGSPFNVAP